MPYEENEVLPIAVFYGLNPLNEEYVPVSEPMLFLEEELFYVYSAQLDLSKLKEYIQKEIVNKILVKIPSLLDQRNHLMHFIEVLTYTQFNHQVEKEIDALFAKFGISKKDVGQERFDQFVKENPEIVEDIEKMILFDVYSVVDENEEIKEKDLKKKLLKDFLRHIDQKYWFSFFSQADSEMKIDIMQELNEKLLRLLYIVNIADYLGFLFMELAQNAEKAHYEYIIGKYLKDIENKEAFIAELENRTKLKELILKNKESLEIEVFSFKSEETHRIRISLVNKGILPDLIQEKIESKMQAENSQKSLSDYFEQSDAMLGAGLGMFYVSYIKEECKKQGLDFVTMIESNFSEEKVRASFELII